MVDGVAGGQRIWSLPKAPVGLDTPGAGAELTVPLGGRVAVTPGADRVCSSTAAGFLCLFVLRLSQMPKYQEKVASSIFSELEGEHSGS